MATSDKKVGLFLAGGSSLLDKSSRFLAVQKKEDIATWIEQMPELSMMADIEPFFVCGEDEVVKTSTIEKMVAIIAKNEKKFNGFVIIVNPDQLIIVSLALSFMLQNFSKTIILTSSQIGGTDYLENKQVINKLKSKYGGLGLRSNLINALQIIGEKLPHPAIMFDRYLIPTTRAKRKYDDGNVFYSIDSMYWATFDFGINLKKKLTSVSSQKKIYRKISTKILILEDILGMPFLMSKDKVSDFEAIFIKSDNYFPLEEDKIEVLNSLKIPVIYYSPQASRHSSNIINIYGCTWQAALVKTMWAIANKKTLPNLSKIMKQDIIGELYN